MIQKSNISKVLELLFDNPNKEYNLKELSRLSKIAHTSVKSYINIMIKEGIILEKKEKKGKRIFPTYKTNIQSQEYRKLKKISNIQRIIESGLIEYLKDKTMPRSIVLFGSYQKGEDTEESDIDIFIESTEKKVNLEQFEKKLNKKIQLHFNSDFDKYSKELKNNIINGLKLFGFLEVFKWD